MKWLGGALVLLVLIGACNREDEPSDSTTTVEGSVVQEQGSNSDAEAREKAEARAARREARKRRAARARKARRARARRERARIEAAVAEALAEAEREEEQAAAASNCDSNYSGACLDPNSSDYDCEGGSGDGPDYVGTVMVVGSDPHDLDRDGDGIACDD